MPYVYAVQYSRMDVKFGNLLRSKRYNNDNTAFHSMRPDNYKI